MSIPRYSREDMAEQVGILSAYGNQDYAAQPETWLNRVLPADEVWVAIPAKYLKGAAAMMSEAANRAPTHAELVEMIDAGLRGEPVGWDHE